MKISVYNFKSLHEITDIELSPMTVMSGVNSSGKSSLIQLMLIIKQTLEINSIDIPIHLEGKNYIANSYLDIIFGKDPDKNKLKFRLSFQKKEIIRTEDFLLEIFDIYSDYTCHIDVSFGYDTDVEKPFVQSFSIDVVIPEDNKPSHWIHFECTNPLESMYSVETNNSIFAPYFWENESTNKYNGKIQFRGFFPMMITYLSKRPELEDASLKDLLKREKKPVEKVIRFRFDDFHQTLASFFNGISYLGPLRLEPLDKWLEVPKGVIGQRGENFAQVLKEEANTELNIYKLDNTDVLSFIKTQVTLIEAVKYWLCDIFKVAQDIRVEKEGEYYSIKIKKDGYPETTLKHVGFGISQVLPILVEGMRMGPSATLVLEQPEIHLHPKLQSSLFDFLYSLILNGKQVILETHSDHLINRMRRRIAEDLENRLANNLSLYFFSDDGTANNINKIDLSDHGTFNYFPSEFMDQTDKELKALLFAQARKRQQQKSK